MFFTHPVLLLVSLASGATQFVTYASLNFTTLFLMREKSSELRFASPSQADSDRRSVGQARSHCSE